MTCTLCNSNQIADFFHINEKSYGDYISKTYYRCSQCQLIFLDPSMHLKPADEKARYDTHENDFENEGYLEFLYKAWLPLENILKQSSSNKVGLDFGCGPNPVLANLISKHYKCSYYDPYFHNNRKLLEDSYDFILSTEVFEHFNSPMQSIEKVVGLIKPYGYLSIMTSFYSDKIDFKSWRYRQDQTHVCFYSKKTFEWLASNYDLAIVKMDNPVVIFKNQ